MSKIKELFLFVLLPLTALFAWIYSLMSKNEALRTKLALERADKDLKAVKAKLESAGKEANLQEGEFREAMERYIDAKLKYNRERKHRQ